MFIGMYVYIERFNQERKAVGVFKDITPDEKLFIQGKYNFWLIHPSQILDFQARPPKDNNGGGNNGR